MATQHDKPVAAAGGAAAPLTGGRSPYANPSLLVGDWGVEIAPESPDVIYQLNLAPGSDPRTGRQLILTKCDAWFRLTWQINVQSFDADVYALRFFSSSERVAQAEPHIEWIEILESTLDRGFAYHCRIATNVRLEASERKFQFRFARPKFRLDSTYILAMQFCQPCKAIIRGFELTADTPFPDPLPVVAGRDAVAAQPVLAMDERGTWYRSIERLNAEMHRRTLTDRAAWLIEMATAALRIECLLTARGIVDYIIAADLRISGVLRGKFARCAVEVWSAYGDVARIRSYLVANLDLLRTDDFLHSAAQSVLGDGLNELPFPATTPGGKPNLYRAYRLLQEQPNAWPSIAMALPTEREKVPDTNLLYWNMLRRTDPDAALGYVNRFLEAQELPAARSLGDGSNSLLSNLRFGSFPAVPCAAKVTVIMAAYNSADTVEYAVRSILSQSYDNLELLFCDDQSSDGTLEKVRTTFQDKRLQLFSSRSNQGPYNIRNALVGHASGDLITFHDADDLALPTRLAEQVEAFKNPDSIATIARWIRIFPDGEVVFFPDHRCTRLASISLMVRRSVMQEAAKFRSVVCGGDSEFFELLRDRYGERRMPIIDKTLIFGLWSERSLTRQPGMEALDSGLRAPSRRCYAEMSGRQRVLGPELVSDNAIDQINVDNGIYRMPQGTIELS